MPFSPELQLMVSPAILRAVLETVTWYSSRQFSGKPFRSPELNPCAILDIPDFSHSSEVGAWIEKKRVRYGQAISWINETRSTLLKREGIEASNAIYALSEIKLLLYEPLETVSDGAAEAASRGFYDLEDAPPWDTWFLYEDHAIFCCVPEFAVGRAQAGIDANPVDCIHWAEWSRLGHYRNDRSL
jgi:hypothetical protein